MSVFNRLTFEIFNVAILRYLARKLGLYGSNDLEASLIDSFYGGVEDLLPSLMSIYRASAEDKPKVRESILNNDGWFGLLRMLS